jgi:hypothetical protein
MQQGHAARTCSMNKQHGKAANMYCTCSMDVHTPYSRFLFCPLPSKFGLWNRASSMVRQREEKARIRAFFALGAFALFRALVLFFASRLRKKRGRPPLLNTIANCY